MHEVQEQEQEREQERVREQEQEQEQEQERVQVRVREMVPSLSHMCFSAEWPSGVCSNVAPLALVQNYVNPRHLSP